MRAHRSALDSIASLHGAVTIAELRTAGITPALQRTAEARGLLVKTGVHTFRAGLVRPTLTDELAYLIADLGPSAWASGPTAAALLGFDGFALRRPLHVTVLRGRNLTRSGAVVHTTLELRPIDRTVRNGIPVTSAPRTIIDLASTCSVAELTQAIDSMIRDRRGSDDLLHRRVLALRGSGRRGIARLVAALDGADAARGGHSFLERSYLRLLGAAGLPAPATQAELGRDRVIRVDCRWPGTPLVVELLGYLWHRTARQMQADARRQNELTLAGFTVLAFTYRDVLEEGAHVVVTTARALGR